MQHSQTAIAQVQAENRPAALPLRDDTMLGICEALGQDFGFHPNWLRIGLATGLLWNPAAIVGIYLGLGVLVVASRLLFPVARRKSVAAAAPASAPAPAPVLDQAPAQEQERELIAA